ncbi:MAG: glycosyltransferase family 4 protein [Clostridia bacterium]|nr:glycosyltransferase family 4 protein [Clostridia bacterium]
MIKVALVSQSPGFAGGEKMLYELAKLLKQTGYYEPLMFIPDDGATVALQMICEKAKIQTVSFRASQWYVFYESNQLHEINSKLVKDKAMLMDLYLRYDVGLVIINTLTNLAPAMAAHALQLPTCLWIHGILDSYLLPSGDLRLRLLIDRYIMNICDQVVCCSEWTQNYYGPLTQKPIRTIFNWIEGANGVSPISDTKLFVCLNTFDQNKGVETLLKAAQILKKKKYEFLIKLYGTGEEEARLRKFVRKNDLGKHVEFCGRTNDVDKVYRACYCLVQPSYIESFGLTVAEAMSYARPVIAAKNGGAEVVMKDRETGLLVPKRDEYALAQAMMQMLENPEMGSQMGKKGRKRYEELFSPEQAKTSFIQLIDEMLADRKKPSCVDLLLDDTWEYLFSNASTPVVPSNIGLFPATVRKSYKEIDSKQLAFSSNIRKKRVYRVHCNKESFSEIRICIDTLGNKLDGHMKVKIKNGKDVRYGLLDLKTYVPDYWTCIQFKPMNDVFGKLLTITLEIDYQDDSAYAGVFENASKITVLTKIMRKLNLTYVIKDLLFVDFE